MLPLEKQSVFSLSHVWFRYASREEDYLFRDLTMEVMRGESVALIGPSGEGKSTILKLMAGLLSPERGTSLFMGQDLRSTSRSEKPTLMRRMGMTFQNSGLFDSLSCGENLEFPLRESGQSVTKEKIRKALEDVGLKGIEGLRTHQISGGMRKRLGIARAHILSPEVVLYDEPTAGLDPLTSRAITDLILTLKREHQVTAVVVTNDPIQAFQVADRIFFVQSGKILQSGDKHEMEKSELPEVRRFLDAFGGKA